MDLKTAEVVVVGRDGKPLYSPSKTSTGKRLILSSFYSESCSGLIDRARSQKKSVPEDWPFPTLHFYDSMTAL